MPPKSAASKSKAKAKLTAKQAPKAKAKVTAKQAPKAQAKLTAKQETAKAGKASSATATAPRAAASKAKAEAKGKAVAGTAAAAAAEAAAGTATASRTAKQKQEAGHGEERVKTNTATGSSTKRKASDVDVSSPKRIATVAATSSAGSNATVAAAAAGLPNSNPLRDAAVVLTGELDRLTRVEVEHRLKAAGAKVMSGVSSKTTFLVVGSHLDDGRKVEETSKYRKYLELKSKNGRCPEVLREDQLLELFAAVSGDAKVAAATAKPIVVVERTFESASERARPWVERHKPEALDELLGNANGVKKLSTWLRDWDDVVLRGRKKAVLFKPGGGMPDNINARAALVSGPPGIGKTTAARLVAKALGWTEVLEYNASDARGQKIINTMSDCLAGNRTISFGPKGLGGPVDGTIPSTKRCLIIMDEVDGLGAGDRGGNAALIRMIKQTKNPIICICNDHSSPKVRSLAFSCYDIRFSRPTKSTIAQRVAEIAASEGLGVEANAMEALAESCGNDIRHVLNQLQVMAALPQYKNDILGYTDMQGRLSEINKDSSIMMNTFEACRNLLTSSLVLNMKTRDRFDHFFLDPNIMHLFIQENYLNSVSRKPVDDELLERCAASAASMAMGDLVNERIRSNQEWNLLPDMGTLSAVYPSFLTNGFVSFPEFPKFLGNYSKMSRAKRLSSELRTILRLSTTTQGRHLVSSGFSDALHSRILQTLRDEEDIAGTAAMLDTYGLQREHVVEHLDELTAHLTGNSEYKLLDTKIKAAMTREMNSGSHAVRVFLPTVKRRRGNSVPEGDDMLGEELEEREGALPAEKEVDDKEDVLGGLVKRAKPSRKRILPAKDGRGGVNPPLSQETPCAAERQKKPPQLETQKAKRASASSAATKATAKPKTTSTTSRSPKAKAKPKAKTKAKAKIGRASR